MKSGKKRKVLINYTSAPVSYDKRKGYAISVYQYTQISLRINNRTLFSFSPQCLCFVYKCSYYIEKIEVIIGRNRIETRNIKVSDKWEELSFDVSRYASISHNPFGLNIKLIIYPTPLSPAVQFHIKEIYFRPYTDTEIRKTDIRSSYNRRKRLLHINLYKYLRYTTYTCKITQVCVFNDL